MGAGRRLRAGKQRVRFVQTDLTIGSSIAPSVLGLKSLRLFRPLNLAVMQMDSPTEWTTTMTDTKSFAYLPIADGNQLVQTDSERSQRKGMDNDDDYYDEVTPSDEVVAKYHIWHHMSIYPPHNVDHGWAKYSPAGEKVGSGKCK